VTKICKCDCGNEVKPNKDGMCFCQKCGNAFPDGKIIEIN